MEINNCSSCGGKVEYSPKDKALKCIKCGNTYSINFKKEVVKKPVVETEEAEGYKEWEKSDRSYSCTNCGAQIVLNDLEMSNKCQYCQTSSLVPLENLPGLKPDKVLPFKISKEEARETFKSKLKSKMFLPSSLKKNIPVAEMGATYLSSFNFRFKVHALYHGIESYTQTIRVNGETRVITKTRPIAGHINHNFDNVVVEVSDKINQNQINAILPFNFNEAYDYDSAFIKGYSVGYYNQPPTEALLKAKNLADGKIEQMIRARYSHNLVSLNVDSNFSEEKYNYSLLPIYFVNYKYKNVEYLNLMNGQNGNIGGKVPRSKLKITFVVLLSLLIIIGVPLLILLLS